MVLNEEQGIKELREKRIAYGISQGRLAVASGITRESHRAADGEVRVVLDERDSARRAGLAKLHVRLVDDEDRVDAFARARHVGGLRSEERRVGKECRL